MNNNINNCRKSVKIITLTLLIVANQISSALASSDLIIGNQFDGKVLSYDQTTGAFLGQFTSGEPLVAPHQGLIFGPDGNLYVSSGTVTKVTFQPPTPPVISILQTPQIQRYNGITGAFMSVFATGPELTDPWASVFGPDGNLYVADRTQDQVLRYNGTTGAFMGVFASGVNANMGTLDTRSISFGPDGNLYVLSYEQAAVLRFNGTTGTFMNVFVSPGSGGAFTPGHLLFGPDGNLYVSGGSFVGPLGIFRYNGSTGEFIDVFASVLDFGNLPFAFTFNSDGSILYVATNGPEHVLRFNGITGVFIDKFLATSGSDIASPVAMILPSKPETITQVTVDIMPRVFPNYIAPKSGEEIPVAILTTSSFNATQVDPLTVKFGPAGAKVLNQGEMRDIDRDGDIDLLLKFNTRKTGILCGDTKAGLTGKTLSKKLIKGSDSIVTVGCKPSH